MIILVCNERARKLGKLDQLFPKLKDETRLYLIPFTLSLEANNALEEWFRPSLIQAVKQATIILLLLQPSKQDRKDPYFNYLPLIYSFLNYHPSVKAKTFFIHPFYHPTNTNLKMILSEKIRLGDFREAPSETFYFLPANESQVTLLQQTIINFIEK